MKKVEITACGAPEAVAPGIGAPGAGEISPRGSLPIRR